MSEKALNYTICTLMKLSFLLILFCIIPFTQNANARGTRISIATGGLMGVYYPTGGAICRLVNLNMFEHGLVCTSRPTSGSQDNINAVQNGIDMFGIAQADKLYINFNNGLFPGLRSVMSIYSETVSIIVAKRSEIRNLDDLRGKRIDVGRSGSGDRYIMSQIFKQKGWSSSTFSKITELGGTDALKGICDGTIDVAIVVAGHPNWITSQATEKCGARVLSFKDDFLDALIRRLPYYTKLSLPAGSYYKQQRATKTFGIMSILFTKADTSNAVVNNVLGSVFKNLESFRESHPILAETNITTAKKVTIPLHNGAIRYYRESSSENY